MQSVKYKFNSYNLTCTPDWILSFLNCSSDKERLHTTDLSCTLPCFPVDRDVFSLSSCSLRVEGIEVVIFFLSSVEDKGGEFSLSGPDCVMSSSLMAQHFSSFSGHSLTYAI